MGWGSSAEGDPSAHRCKLVLRVNQAGVRSQGRVRSGCRNARSCCERVNAVKAQGLKLAEAPVRTELGPGDRDQS